MPRVRIGTAIAESFGFIGPAWGRAWGILLVWLALVAGVQAIQGLRPELAFITILVWPFTFAASTAAIGALYRIGIEAGHPGDPAFRAHPAGLYWGMLEWRVLGANLLLGLILGGIFVALLLLWFMGVAIASVGGNLQSGDVGAVVSVVIATLVVWIPGGIGLLYLGARWLMFPLIAADTTSFNLGWSWTLTRGSVFAVIVALIVVSVVDAAASVIVYLVVGVAASAATKEPTSGFAWASLGAQFVGILLAPIAIGLQHSVYRQTRPDGGVDIAATFS